MRYSTTFVAVLTALACSCPYASEHFYTGMCDASAAAWVDDDQFVVANDEDNTLRIYRLSKPGAPERSRNVQVFFGPDEKQKKDGTYREADIEGAARHGRHIYWITSHGANAEGKARPERHKLFALDVEGPTKTSPLSAVGTPYRALESALKQTIAITDGAPESPGALNIEGLASGPDGSLLIGMRNPVPDKRAVIVQLLNPYELVKPKGKAALPKFGPVTELDLGGLGIRSIEAIHPGRDYLIVGGPVADGTFALFSWRLGEKSATRLDLALPENFRPEGMLISPDGRHIHLLSDDGDEPVAGVACKKLPQQSDKKFRLMTIAMPRGR